MPRRIHDNLSSPNGEQVPVQAVPDPILCNPYHEPTAHWVYHGGKPSRMGGRRPASYWFTTQRTGSLQRELIAEEQRDDLPLVNRLREDVKRWRESGYRGATEVTRELLKYWTRQDRVRRLFFCQQEAVETLVYLLEMRIPGRSGRTGFRNFQCSDEDLQRLLKGERPDFYGRQGATFPSLADQPIDLDQLPLLRLGCKMATGSGKTVVMAMLIAWAFCNRGRNPRSTEFPSGVLICCPNLTVKKRLQVLKPKAQPNYYAEFDIVPARFRDLMSVGEVMVTNWHVFGLKSPGSEGEVSYRVVDKGEEDNRAFALDRLGDLAHRLPLLVLNDEGHHCWRPRFNVDEVKAGLSGEDRDNFDSELEEARVWLDGLDRINNSGLLGGGAACIGATVDMSATPFFIGGSGHIEGSPFPWLVSDFGLVDAIESGIVKIPRLPVLEEGGPGRKDDGGRPDPKYFRLWRHIIDHLKPSDRVGKRPKPEALYRDAEGALLMLAAQWKERFEQFRSARPGLEVVPPVLIVVCPETDTARVFYEAISGEHEEEVPKQKGKGTEVRTAYGTSRLAPELQNEEGMLRTIRIDSKLLAKLEADEGGTRDEKAEALRRVIDTIGKPGEPGEFVRCVVSVQMLTEGWDANNVTQILGVRAFESQLLCEQVVGRGLRRRSYVLNPETDRFDPEYVDVYGIPFSLIPFKGRPKDETEVPDKPRHRVWPLPDRQVMEIRAPRVESYCYALRQMGLQCDVSALESLVVDEEPSAVYVNVPRGYCDHAYSAADLNGEGLVRQDREAFYATVHEQAIHFLIASRVLDRLIEGIEATDEQKATFRLQARFHLFGEILKVVKEYICTRVKFADGVNRKEIGLQKNIDRVVGILADGILPAAAASDQPLIPIVNRVHPYHSTIQAETLTTLPVLPVEKSHMNAVPLRSSMEREVTILLERLDVVEYFTPNLTGFGLRIPYLYMDTEHDYMPDFIVQVRGGCRVVLEAKDKGGEIRDPNQVQAKNQAARKWVSAVNNAGRYGKWAFEICRPADLPQLAAILEKHAKSAKAVPFQHVLPSQRERFKTCVPFMPLRIAAGAFTPEQATLPGLFEADDWVVPRTSRRLAEGMFVAQVRGDSMQPTIPSGSYCLFRKAEGVSQEGRIVLVQHNGIWDPVYAGGYTVKKLHTERLDEPDADLPRTRVELCSLNPDYPPIEMVVVDERELRVVAELVEVLGLDNATQDEGVPLAEID